MIALRLYRLTLRLLPDDLYRKHADSMESLFVRDAAEAREHGRVRFAEACARSVWDVVVRASYERVRPSQFPAPEEAMPSTRQLLRGHAVSFAVAFVLLTITLLSLSARSSVPRLIALGASTGTIAEALLLSVPFVAALTIPMAVLLAVLQQFTRLGARGTLTAALQTRDGVRRLVLPVLAAATGVVVCAFVVTAEVVPRTNQQLSELYSQTNQQHSDLSVASPAGKSEREMTISELRHAAREAQVSNAGIARASMLHVEVHKKFALPVACLVFALAGMALAFRMPRGGWPLVVVASVAVYVMYYTLLMSGETFADRQLVSPRLAMWSANVLLTAVALTLAWQRASKRVPIR